MIRLLIADDHTLFRQGLRQLLAEQTDLKVVAEAANHIEIFEQLRKSLIDVAIIDFSMPGRDGAELIEEIKSFKADLPVLVLTMHSHEQYASRTLKAGASGYITKDCAAEQVVSAIHKLAQGGHYVSPHIAERLAMQFARKGDSEAPHTSLSDREFKIFEMLVQGKTGNQIAEELSISKKTVSTHKVRLLKKMNLRNDFDLFNYAIEHRLELPSQFNPT
jgi:two-component system, NarL family, invasion response regulator UvrY